MIRHLRLAPFALCAALIAAQHAGAAAAPGNDRQATITYTATHMRQAPTGRNVGEGALTVDSVPAFCDDQRTRLGRVRKVSADRPETRLSVPADQPLILQSFWSGADRHCLLGNLAFRAEPGADYRVTAEVDLGTGQCRVLVSQQDGDGNYRDIGELQTLDQICR